MRLDSEWVEDTRKIIQKNKRRGIALAIVTIITLILFIVLLGTQHVLWGFISFGLGILIMIFLVPKKIKLAFSEMIAYDLFQIFVNIEKWDGKNEHFKEECEDSLKDLNSEIEEYIYLREGRDVIDFLSDKIVSYLKNLKNQNRKVTSILMDYTKYESEKDKLEDIYHNLAFLFHDNDKFPDEASDKIKELEALSIDLFPEKVTFKKKLKKYLIENKLWVLIIFILVFTPIVWFTPNYTDIMMTKDLRLTIIITIVGGAIAQYLFSSRKQDKKEDIQ